MPASPSRRLSTPNYDLVPSQRGIGLSYEPQLTATGGFVPYTWTITRGALPGGLTLNASSGQISGIPTNSGRSSFTLHVSDGGTPAVTATISISIVINPAPATSAALCVTDQTGLQIPNDGSLTLLPSSPETAIPLLLHGSFSSSPTLPLIFFPYGTTVNGLVVKPRLLLELVCHQRHGPRHNYDASSVDPTGSNVYLTGSIDSNNTAGVLILPSQRLAAAVGHHCHP